MRCTSLLPKAAVPCKSAGLHERVVRACSSWLYAQNALEKNQQLEPSRQRRQQQIELCELAVESVKAMGFQAGALHVELKYTSRNGPQLIEVRSAGLISSFCTVKP